MSPDRGRKPLLCRLSLHSWAKRIGENGQRYRQCRRCGKEKYDAPMTRGDSIG